MPEAPLATILIVDDTPENLSVLSQLLQPAYRVRAATSGRKALRIATSEPKPDLILLDVMMPGMDGYEVFKLLRADQATRDIPVVFITALDNAESEIRALSIGAADFISKPIVPPVVLARIQTQLELKRARDLMHDQNAWLEAEVARRMKENELIQAVGIRALAHLAETRDPETGNHILRTQAYVRLLATLLVDHPHFASTLAPHYIELLARSAPLHDIGKVGIPDAILLKPGKLSPEEWDIMRTHAKLGAEAIELAERDLNQNVEFLTLAKEIAHWHHERWDGSGYPDGLIGEAIPISARLMSVADAFDALISVRVYKPALPFDTARDIIAAGRGHQFDPDVVDVFLAHFGDFTRIAQHYLDDAPPPAGSGP